MNFSGIPDFPPSCIRITQKPLKTQKEIREKHTCTWTGTCLLCTSPFCKPDRSTVSALLEHGSSRLNPGADVILFLCFNLTYLTLFTSYGNRDSNFPVPLCVRVSQSSNLELVSGSVFQAHSLEISVT